MDADGAGSGGSCYYSLLGIWRNASSSDIRTAYRKKALIWHPDRWAKDPTAMGEAKRRFQRIQEAYSVLSDKGKRAVYDAGLYDPLEEDDQDFTDFMQEMLAMMDSVKTEISRPVATGTAYADLVPCAGNVCSVFEMPKRPSRGKPDSLEDLQKMLADIVNGDGGATGFGEAHHIDARRVPSDASNRTRGATRTAMRR